MKLSNKDNSIDLTEEEKDSSVYKQIADKYSDKIPIIKSLSKKKKHFSFWGQESINELIVKMATKSKKFNSPAEVSRAALYMGTMIMYHQIMGDTQNYKEKIIYNNIFRAGKLDESYQMLESCIEIFDRLISAAHDNIKTESDLIVQAEKVILELPENLHKKAEKIFNEQYQGSSPQSQKRKLILKNLGGRPKLKRIT